jgi:small subunit ribosomal protein S1
VSNDVQPSSTPSRLEDLQPKMKLTGTVKKVELFGAFVDVGVGRDGLVHISALSPQRVNQVSDVVKEGDAVTVWVRKVDPETKRLDLTMIEPLGLDWNEIKAGQIYTGKVVKLEKFGAFVDIGAERPGMVHISEMATYRVEEVSEVAKMGEEVQVKVLGVDPRKKQIKLSIKAVDAAEEAAVADEEEEEAGLTAMQIAFKRAQDGRAVSNRPKAKVRQVRREQEDILSRTLQSRRK